MAATKYSPRGVAKKTTVVHQIPPLRSGTVDWSNLRMAGDGRAKIVEVHASTGVWAIAQKYYGGSNLDVKERVRIVRQANPGWKAWPSQIVPAGTALVLPPIAKQFVEVPGAAKIVVDRGDGLYNVVDRHYRNRGVVLSPKQISALIPTIAVINGVFDVENELEPGWVLYVPDEAVDNACGTALCKSTKHETGKADSLGDLSVGIHIQLPKDLQRKKNIDMSSVGYMFSQALASSSGAALLNGDRGLIVDAFKNNPLRFVLSDDGLYMTFKGSNRELLKSLGLPGTRYRVGSPKFVEAMESYAAKSGSLVSEGANMAIAKSALLGAGKSIVKGSAYGAIISIGFDATTYVINGESDKILTKEFAVSAGNNAVNSAIATGAGATASALAVAYMGAGGGSVVPGLGTAAGFVVGLAVGFGLSYFHVSLIH